MTQQICMDSNWTWNSYQHFHKSLFLTVHNIHECKIKISFAGQKTLKKKKFKDKILRIYSFDFKTFYDN